MQRIFLNPEQFDSDTARITGADHLHLARVMRARAGESLVVLDGRGNAFRAELVSIGKSESAARIVGLVEVSPEPSVYLTVAQALGKGDKFEQVIQHGTEVGASAFIPIRAERSVVDIPASRVTKRVARWQQIVKGAAEQSGRSLIPPVAEPQTLAQLAKALAAKAETSRMLLLHPDTEALPLHRILQEIAPSTHLVLAIGPEGGWSPTEVSAVQAATGTLISLGPRVLRTETAALVALSQIVYHFERIGNAAN